MSRSSAQAAVALSAFWVAAIFAYRKLTEHALPNNAASPIPQTAHFVIGFGFTYVVLSTAAVVAPAFGGMLAVLVATGDMLANGKPLLADLQGGLNATTTATGRG